MDTSNEIAVGELLRQHGWSRAFTLAGMVSEWSRLVGAVERGYNEQVYEYTNDLCCRNWLHEAWPLLDDAPRQKWNARVKDLDDRFRAVTVEDDGLAVGYFYKLPAPEMWWWRRYPRILTGSLGLSLREAGAIEQPRT